MLRKYMSILIAFSIGITGVFIANSNIVYCEEKPQVYLLNENFENVSIGSLPTGFTGFGKVERNNDEQYLKSSSDGSWKIETTSYSFSSPLMGSINLEFRINSGDLDPDGKERSNFYSYITKNNDKPSTLLQINPDTTIRGNHNEGINQLTVKNSSNEWYYFRIYMDTDTNTVILSLYDSTYSILLSSTTYADNSLSSGISSIDFNVESGVKRDFLIDDLKIYKTPEFTSDISFSKETISKNDTIIVSDTVKNINSQEKVFSYIYNIYNSNTLKIGEISPRVARVNSETNESQTLSVPNEDGIYFLKVFGIESLANIKPVLNPVTLPSTTIVPKNAVLSDTVETLYISLDSTKNNKYRITGIKELASDELVSVFFIKADDYFEDKTKYESLEKIIETYKNDQGVLAKTVYSDQILSNGSDFSVDFETQEKDWFIVFANTKNGTEPKSIPFYIASEEAKTEILNDKIKREAVTADDIYETLNNDGDRVVYNSMGLNFTFFDTLGIDVQKSIANKIFNKKSTITTSNISSIFNILCDVENYNFKPANEIKTTLESLSGKINISMGENSLFFKSSDVTKADIYQKLAGDNVNSYVDIENSFNHWLTVACVNNSMWNIVEDTLKTQEGTSFKLGLLNNTDYIKLAESDKYKMQFYMELKKVTIYANIESFKTEFLRIAPIIRAEYEKSIVDSKPDRPFIGGNAPTTTVKSPAVVVPVATPIPTLKPSFKDLDENHWAKKSIETLKEKGVLAGDENNNINPDKEVKRVEFIKMLVNAFNLLDKNATCEFLDVPKDSWYYEFVATAKKLGITNGNSETTFGSNDLITREDMAVLTYRVINKVNENEEISTADSNFSDKNLISNYANDAINYLKEKEIINGMENGNFAPKSTSTRAQAAQIIFKIISK